MSPHIQAAAIVLLLLAFPFAYSWTRGFLSTNPFDEMIDTMLILILCWSVAIGLAIGALILGIF